MVCASTPLAASMTMTAASTARTPDGVFAALREGLSDEEILELSYVIGLYEMHATLCRALRLEFDDVDERVVEIPAPEAEGGGDFMAGVGRDD